MNDFVEEMVNHRKFMDLPEEDVDDELKKQKQSNPKSIPYAICWMEMHPGYASLRFVASTSARSHIIGISPKGYSWCEIVYSSVDSLINAFKRNPRGVSKPKEGSREVAKPATENIKPVSKGRWGSKPAPPSLPPPAPPGVPGWAPRPPPPPMPPLAPLIPPVAAGWGGGWNHGPPPPRPPPPNLPPPPAYGAPPSQRPPMPNLPPPPPPGGPAGPPPFGMPPAAQSQGRGRGRTLPAWMNKGALPPIE
jgi:SH2 domain